MRVNRSIWIYRVLGCGPFFLVFLVFSFLLGWGVGGGGVPIMFKRIDLHVGTPCFLKPQCMASLFARFVTKATCNVEGQPAQ